MHTNSGSHTATRRIRVACVMLIATFGVILVACKSDKGDASKTPEVGTATARAQTVTASGSPVVREIRNAEGTVVATEVVRPSSDATNDASTALSGGTPVASGGTLPPGGSTPNSVATAPPDTPSTPTPAATLPPGAVAPVSLDSNPSTQGVDHTPVSVPVGSTFDVAIVITPPNTTYQGYEYAIHWEEGALSYVSEKTLTPAELSLCAPISAADNGVAALKDSIYGGCLRTAGETDFAGPASIVTFKCERAGTTLMRTLTLAEGPFGTGLLKEGGVEFAGQVDEGFDVTCT